MGHNRAFPKVIAGTWEAVWFVCCIVSAGNDVCTVNYRLLLVKNALQSVLHWKLLNNGCILLSYYGISFATPVLAHWTSRTLCRGFLSQNSSWYRSQWTVGLWGNTYPGTYVPHGSLGSCTMDPKPFRTLLSTVYSGVD